MCIFYSEMCGGIGKIYSGGTGGLLLFAMAGGRKSRRRYRLLRKSFSAAQFFVITTGVGRVPSVVADLT